MNYYRMGIISNDIDFLLYYDRFLTHHTSMLVLKNSSLPIKAYTTDIKEKYTNLLSTIGELFEREVLINKNQKKAEDITGFSLLNGTFKSIPKRDVIFIDKFVDSCGMASHTNSYLLIKKAVFEFFERQCLVLSYLSKTPASKVKNSFLFKNEELNIYRKYLLNFIDELKFYNISISNQVFVILGIGVGEQNKCIGIGTSEILGDALKKAMQEMLQYFMYTFSKDSGTLDSIEDKTRNIERKDLYHEYFDSLSSNELNQKYDYLENEFVLEITEKYDSFNLQKFLKELKSGFNMDLYAFYFSNQRNLSNTKTVKILDFNWFPNILPLTYKTSVYSYVEANSSYKLDHNCKYIPFP